AEDLAEAAEDLLEDLAAHVLADAPHGAPYGAAAEAAGAERRVGAARGVGVLLLEDAPERLAGERAHQELGEDGGEHVAVGERRAGLVVLPARELAPDLLELGRALAVGLRDLLALGQRLGLALLRRLDVEEARDDHVVLGERRGQGLAAQRLEVVAAELGGEELHRLPVLLVLAL